ncbi:TIGR02234 family membrane protein [Tsukamurella spumae]|uniref:TIGR02234 family membrane protein n=1 Tax=Tsukamurella spumae TaxID=44753 RepID=A0A846WUZ5_9ACTN|nr:TIGR02234 family membrane protein [Tsukamurella spumae]NKY16918.1 TIGR02234 family membrane protein [Tsukamurella spumae]
MKSKRNLALVALLLAGAAGAAWGSGRMSWMGVTLADGLSAERSMSVAGHTWAPALSALWLVFLAAIAAGLALKTWARALVAVIVAAAAIGTAYPALTVLTQEPDIGYLEKILRGGAVMGNKDYISAVSRAPAGPSVALVAALLAVLAAALLVRGLRAGGMGAKYVSPAARRAQLEQRVFDDAAAEEASERDLWDALDGGEDPTTTGVAEAAPGQQSSREGAAPERPRTEG